MTVNIGRFEMGEQEDQGQQQEETPVSQEQDKKPGKESRTFTQDEVNDIIKKRLSEERERTFKKYGDLEALAEAASKKTDDSEIVSKSMDSLKSEISKWRSEAIRMKVGMTKQLPSSIAEGLVGETEEELMAHADRILADIASLRPTPPKKPEAPDTNAFEGSGPGIGEGRTTTPLNEDEKEIARRYRIPEDEYRELKKKAGLE
jgi:hypothetical protein